MDRSGVMDDGGSGSPWAGTVPVASLASSEGSVILVEAQTFCVSGRSGDLSPEFPHGLFVLDVRVLSCWRLVLNGHRLEPLTVAIDEPFSATFAARGYPAAGRADADLVCFRRRDIGNGMRERIEVTNHGLTPVEVELEAQFEADFADVFEVKESRVRRRGRHGVEVDDEVVRFQHQLGDLNREVELRLPAAVDLTRDRAVWRRTLQPRQTLELCVDLRVRLGGQDVPPRFTCGDEGTGRPMVERLVQWRAELPRVATDHATLAEAVERASGDLGALRIFDPEHPEVPILAAGAPWFMTVFGRDSLLTAWMTLLADPSLAEGVIATLARFQGDDDVPQTEEEPGKILHEIRFASSGGLALGGGDIYYGTVDATPLFVMLLDELRRWDLDGTFVRRMLPHADRALEWIERCGDRDGDGFVEYLRRSPDGLANQGWKDSWDAIRHADGELARGPIALCEVQGYVYAAYQGRAAIARSFGDDATFERYRDRAVELRRRFNAEFWLEDQGWFALALDGDKRPVRALASNMGHALWTGIVDPELAPLVARQLTGPELFSGWGIRTLGTSMPAFNPVSYHNGSVWPHDNALCVAGLARYGFLEEAHRVIAGQLGVAHAYRGRLPELFAGFDRRDLSAPASYPASCSPQAWASASPLLWLRALLGLDPVATDEVLWIDPQLPAWIERLQVDGIRVAGRHLTITAEAGQVEVEGAGGLEVRSEARTPETAGRRWPGSGHLR
jgi:glycogen debranching enzyme